jgi:hypothetical protein
VLIIPRKNIRISNKTGTEIIHSDEDDDDELAHIHSEEEDTEDEDDEDEDDEDDDDWVAVPDTTRSDDLDPSESASRSRHPIAASARSYPYGRPPARRSQSARKSAYPEVVEPPRGPTPARRAGKERISRTKSSAPSTMSNEEDDYIYPPNMGQYPPEWGRGGGFRGGMYPGGAPYGADPYIDQFMDPGQSPNPFAMGPGSADYFGRRGNRMSMPIRGGNELMSLNHGYGYGFPPGYPYPYHPPSLVQSPSPHNSVKKATPPPVEEKAVSDPRIDAITAMLMEGRKREEQRQQQELARRIDEERRSKERQIKEEEDKLKRLELLILKHNQDQLEREKKAEAARLKEETAKKEAELRELQQKKITEEKEKEIKHAAETAKHEAEKEAAKKAAEEKEKFDKKTAEEKEKFDKELEEIKKKAAEVEAAKKKFEEEAKKLRPGDDMLKAPIRFKDALGRKFSFPWHICKTWKVRDIFSEIRFIANLHRAWRD